MESTPASLLEELRKPNAARSWERFVLLYSPLIYNWIHRLRFAGPDADDLLQDIFTTLVQKLPEFHYERGLRFRGWLWTLTLNKVRERRRKATIPFVEGDVDHLSGRPEDDPATAVDAREYREYLTRRALDLMQSDFDSATWQAFWQTVVEGRSVKDTARELDITVNAVYLSRGRVLQRLRTELAGLLD